MTEIELLKIDIISCLKPQLTGVEFLRGDNYLAPSELPQRIWGGEKNYTLFWAAVYELRDSGIIHIRYEANANMLALTPLGVNLRGYIRGLIKTMEKPRD